ncbi:MAG TPA: peptidoglycan-associated lipoprotein Pal [Thermoanaerobaculia bacterium]|nr:peptidoglycan-associated lipoprotein Pal [Thermoanaerobaculia bacterium]
MTSNVRRILLVALVVVALSLAFGCRTRTRTPAPAPEPVPTVTETAPPPVTVEPPEDFVTEPEPEVEAEDLSGTIAQVNERAHRLGWIRDVFFEFDAFALSADAQDALAVTASWMKSHPEYRLLIEGHADERGTQQYNLALGDRRANIARDYMITLGVQPASIRTISYGEERPFAIGSSEQAWAQNRRAHMVLTRN